MLDPDMLDKEEFEYSLDLSSTNLDFEETQELKYSMDLSTNSSENTDSKLSSNNDNRSTGLSSDTDLGTDSELSYDDDDELTNLNEHLKPYNYEPSCQPRKDFISNSENDEDSDVSSDSNQEHSRKGNSNWCACWYCWAIETEIESFCCRDTNKAPDNYFEGHKCITESKGFKMVWLSKPVLDNALSVLNHFRGDLIKNIDKSYCLAGYKQYTFWVYNYLGKGAWKIITSCVVWKIRSEFKSENNLYVPFADSIGEE